MKRCGAEYDPDGRLPVMNRRRSPVWQRRGLELQTADRAFRGREFVPIGNNEPVKLSSIPGRRSPSTNWSRAGSTSPTARAHCSVPFTRPPFGFDWAELTVIPSSSDVANLTAVDQFRNRHAARNLQRIRHEDETVGLANLRHDLQRLRRKTLSAARARPSLNSSGKGSSGSRHPTRATRTRNSASTSSDGGKKITQHRLYGDPFTTSQYCVPSARRLNHAQRPDQPAWGRTGPTQFPGAQVTAGHLHRRQYPRNNLPSFYRSAGRISTGLVGRQVPQRRILLARIRSTTNWASGVRADSTSPPGDARKSPSSHPAWVSSTPRSTTIPDS